MPVAAVSQVTLLNVRHRVFGESLHEFREANAKRNRNAERAKKISRGGSFGPDWQGATTPGERPDRIAPSPHHPSPAEKRADMIM
jgi:hypothetical protein